MRETKTSRFGKKAMSLLLSGAMIMAFAPAVGAGVSADGIEQAFAAQTDEAYFVDATVTDVTVDGTSVTVSNNTIDPIAFNGIADENGASLVQVKSVKLADNTVEDVSSSKWIQTLYMSQSSASYGSITDWVAVNATNVADIGKSTKFKIEVTAADQTGVYAGAVHKFYFQAKAGKLAGATLYEINPADADDASDTSFECNGANLASKIGVALSGSPVDLSGSTVQICKHNTTTAETGATKAGTYTVKVTGGNYEDASFTLTVSKLDITNAKITLREASNGTELEVASIEGVDSSALGYFTCTPDTVYDGTAGTYTATVTPTGTVTGAGTTADAANDFFTGAGKGTYIAADAEADVAYVVNGSAASSITVDLGATNPSYYDAANWTVTEANGGTTATAAELAAAKASLKLTYKDSTGAEVSADALKTAGTYTVDAEIDSAATGVNYSLKGSSSPLTSLTVVVKNPAVASVTATYDGSRYGTTATGAATVAITPGATYTGSDLAKTIGITVVDATGSTLAQGTDYTVEYKKGSVKVDEIVDVGNYEIVVTPKNRPDGVGVVTFTVNVVAVTPAKAKIEGKAASETSVTSPIEFAYTGSAIDMASSIAFYTTENGVDAAVTVPSDQYTLSYKKLDEASGTFIACDDVTAMGTYQVVLADNQQIAATADYDLSKAAGTWYVKVVAQQVGYVEMAFDKYMDNAKVKHTGEDLTPSLVFYTANPATDRDAAEVTPSAASYSVSYLYSQTATATGGLQAPVYVSSINDPGFYQVVVKDLSATDEYTFGDGNSLTGANIIEVAKAEEGGNSSGETTSQKNQSISIPTVYKQTIKAGGKKKLKVKGAKTKVTFSKKEGSKYLSVTSSGTIKVSKKAKKGKTYTIKVVAKAKATAKYKADKEIKRFYITVK